MEVKTLKDSSKRYRESYYNENGRKIMSPSFERKSDAQAWKHRMQSRFNREKSLGLFIKDQILFEELVRDWLSSIGCHSPCTLKDYQSVAEIHLIPRLGSLRLEQIRPNMGLELKNSLLNNAKKKISHTRINFILRIAKQIFFFAVKYDYLSVSPFRNLDYIKVAKKPIVFWNKEEIEKFLFMNKDEHYFNLYLFALNTGLRKGEICGLCWDSVDFKEQKIIIQRNMTRYGLNEQTKSKKSRMVYLNETALSVLQNLKSKNISSQFVFTSQKGEAVDYEHLTERHFKQAIRRAGVRSIKFHNLRSSFASNYVMSGGNIFDLSKILGHYSVGITENCYANLNGDYFRSVANVLEFKIPLAG